ETIADSLADMIVNFDDANSAAASLLNTLAQMFAKSAIGSLGLDKLFGSIFPSADGNVFSGGRPVHAFANGGVVSGPTFFPMRGNQTGLMGEAGPEAIMPLTRLANGKLGVQSQGGGQASVHVTVGIDPENGNVTAYTDQRANRAIAQAAPAIIAAQDRRTGQNIQNFSRREG
ncbi:MAG: phage tail tape measure protein, partial [Pikeienuella sp.]